MRSDLIYNRAKAQQLLAFDGMQYGKCRPTDIDCSIDFQQKLFVFVELKTAGSPLTTGQRIHLEGLVDAIVAGGRGALAILAHHVTPDPDTDVHVANAIVYSLYDGVQWVKEENPLKLDTFLHYLYQTQQQGTDDV